MADLKQLQLEHRLEKKLLELMDEREELITFLAGRLFDDAGALEKESDMVRLAVVVRCLDHTKKIYDRLKIGEDIFYDTMKDISVWCGNNGNKGLDNYQWLLNHVKGELFKLGRLQFQLYQCNNSSLDYSLLPFGYGENVIFIHIPQGEKLTYEDCVRSIGKAKIFFKEYFPDYEYRYFLCESWLLFENNKQFMDENSNIIKFSSLFHIAYSVYDDSQAIERIFGKREDDINNYPETTSLRRAAKNYMAEGNKLGMGIGTINAFEGDLKKE